MSPRSVALFVSLGFAGAAVIGLLGLDREIATRTAVSASEGTVWDVGTRWLEIVALKDVSTFLLGFLIVAAAGLLLLLKRRGGWVLMYIGLVQFLATTIVDLSKTPFGRLRPHEAMPDGAGVDRWFVGAQSFPSGHTAFYAGLVFPIVMLWPRAWPLLGVPLFIAIARVVSHDHYLSDVAASLAVAALLSALLLPLASRRASPPPRNARSAHPIV